MPSIVSTEKPRSNRFFDLSGQTFGKLTVLSYAGKDGKGNTYFECQCECGNTQLFRGESVKSGRTKSCGLGSCHHFTTHGKAKTPTHISWLSMMQRCYNPNAARYYSHGARGITVCQSWHDFSNFLADMGERPSTSYSLDRINNDGNYEPNNCRWATAREQAQNTRRNRMIEYGGIIKPLSQWGREYSIDPETVSERLKKGWSIHDALTKPLR